MLKFFYVITYPELKFLEYGLCEVIVNTNNKSKQPSTFGINVIFTVFSYVDFQ